MKRRAPNRSLRTDLVAGFATLVFALAIVGGYALYRQARAVASLRLQDQGYLPLSLAISALDANQSSMDAMLESIIDVQGQGRAAWRTSLTVPRPERRRRVHDARALARQARADAQSAEDVTVLDTVDRTLAQVERAYREDEPEFGRLFDALAANDTVRARAVHRPLFEREQGTEYSLIALNRDLERRIKALAASAEQEQPRTLRVLSIVTISALVIGLITLLSAYRALRPLALLIDRVRAVARGDLSPRVVPSRADEIGELADEFDNMVDAVKNRDQALRDKAEEIRRAEQHLEQVVATLRAAVMVVLPDGMVASANPAARRLAARAELTGLPFVDTTFGRVEAIARAVAETASRGGQGVELLAVPMGERALDVTVTTFVAPSGHGSGALVVADDVTEREQARARLLQNERLAAIGRMAAHVTHEVRNPLSSMALNAEMLADEAVELGEPGREMKRLVGAIQREIDRLTGITEEYLRVARLPRPRLEREDVRALVDETVKFLTPEFSRAGIALTVIERGAIPSAMIDEAQIRQALLNLLRNAREALESQPVERRAVKIILEPLRDGVAISLADSGPGIRPEVRLHLFELFFTTKERGSGLGLPLTREIVRAHGGDIEVTSAERDEGGGAKFVIWLPANAVGDAKPTDGGTRDAA